MSSLTTAPVVVNPEIPVYDPIAEMRGHIDQLVARMTTALDEIAEAAGAWHCDYCGDWTTDTIQVANYSDEMGYETREYCARCVEVS